MESKETYGPLEALSRVLRRGPPCLSALLDMMGGVEDYTVFVSLVREFLPDREDDILSAGSHEDVIQAFATAFGERYFPLDDIVFDEGFAGVIGFIPVVFRGFNLDDYHFLPDWRSGFLLGTLLVDFEEELGLDGEGIRVTVMEVVEGIVSRELLERVPSSGYSLDFLRREVPTSLVGLVRIAEYLCHDTGCVFLDATNEELCYDPPCWERGTVDYLTEQWPMAERIDSEMVEFMEWIEERPEARFGELVRFLERRVNGRRARIALGAAPGNRGASR